MKTGLDHLPEKKQREIERVVDILHEEFEDALGISTAAWKRKGRILKIILFGSYARGDWVDELHTTKGYRSDLDLLVIVNNEKLAAFETYWYKAKDRIQRSRAIETPVSFIVHSLGFVNSAISKGQYFFTDIRKEGIVLYELDDKPLVTPKPLTPEDAYLEAKAHFDQWSMNAKNGFEFFRFGMREEKLKDAAFMLHQTVERLYQCLLLTLTNYSPPSHNINFLRSLAEGHDRRLVAAWPRDTKRHRAWFNTLAEAYVKARYSKHYEVSEEALTWLGERVTHLHKLVETVCKEHLARLAREAGLEHR